MNLAGEQVLILLVERRDMVPTVLVLVIAKPKKAMQTHAVVKLVAPIAHGVAYLRGIILNKTVHKRVSWQVQ